MAHCAARQPLNSEQGKVRRVALTQAQDATEVEANPG